MVVNEKKTTLMYFAAVNSYQARAKLTLAGAEIKSQDKVKLLGVTINKKCAFGEHALDVKNKLRAKTWALGKLKKAGMTEQTTR